MNTNKRYWLFNTVIVKSIKKIKFHVEMEFKVRWL